MIAELLIPLVLFLVIGAVLLTWIFYRSKERQMMIERGLTTEQMKELLQSKKDPYILLKMGIIILFFGIGLGVGMFLEEISPSDYWVPFSLFAFVGAGFIVAYNAARKVKFADENKAVQADGESSE